MPAKRVLSPEQVSELIRLYEAGATGSQLAERYLVSPATVWAYLRRAGAKVRPSRYPLPPPLSSEAILETCELIRKGLSQREVAEILGIHQTTVSYRVKRYCR
jgi:DNA-binding CsgD family transcriptional regulator